MDSLNRKKLRAIQRDGGFHDANGALSYVLECYDCLPGMPGARSK